MDISKEVLYKKFQDLVPELAKNVKPELFSSLCDNTTFQPFLKWFVKNVTQHNILTEEEIEIAKQIKQSGSWITGPELDEKLKSVLKNYPELEKEYYSDTFNINEPLASYEIEKEQYTKDLEYLTFLQNQYKQLKIIENELEEKLDNDDAEIEKLQIESQLSYQKCSQSIENIDLAIQNFSASLKQLLDIYNDIYSKSSAYTWVQMPLDSFIKQLETYTTYLEMYIKKQFKEPINYDKPSNTSLNDCDRNEYMLQMPVFKSNLLKAKDQEINYKVEENASKANFELLSSLYDNGNLTKIPQNSAEFRSEMCNMIKKRDVLQENVEILQVRLRDTIDNFGEMECNNFLVYMMQELIENRKQNLEKLEHLKTLIRENGHAYSDFLCLLISSQHRLISEFFHFAKDAQHYLQSEYSLAEKRCESMQHIQDKYNNILSSYTNEQNIFNQLILQIMGLDKTNDVYKAIQKYDVLIDENNTNRKMFEEKYSSVMQEIEKIDKDFSEIYLQQLDNGLTRSFQLIDNVSSARIEEATNKVEKCEYEFKSMHNKFKETAKNIDDCLLDRKSKTLWQVFLAAPHLMQIKYDELKIKADTKHFKDNLKNNVKKRM